MWINGKWSLIWINSEPIIDVERSDHIQICLVSILFKIVVNNLKTREIFIVFVLNVSSKHKNVAIEEIKGLKLNLCQVWINLENWLAQKYVGPYPAHQFKTNFPQNPAQFFFFDIHSKKTEYIFSFKDLIQFSTSCHSFWASHSRSNLFLPLLCT